MKNYELMHLLISKDSFLQEILYTYFCILNVCLSVLDLTSSYQENSLLLYCFPNSSICTSTISYHRDVTFHGSILNQFTTECIGYIFRILNQFIPVCIDYIFRLLNQLITVCTDYVCWTLNQFIRVCVLITAVGS